MANDIDKKISEAWRAHDDADAELLEIQRLAQVSRDNGPEEPSDPPTLLDFIRALWIRWMT